jgi:hypothetical protein
MVMKRAYLLMTLIMTLAGHREFDSGKLITISK